MFSVFELTVIKSWALTGKEILEKHLNSEVFTHAEKEDKRREYAALDSIIEEAKRVQTEYVSLDADHMGHLLFICDEYLGYLNEQCQDGILSAVEYATGTYQVGRIQRGLELGMITAEDINGLNEWENKLEASNQELSEE